LGILMGDVFDQLTQTQQTEPAQPAQQPQAQDIFDQLASGKEPTEQTPAPAKLPPQLRPYDEAKHGQFTTPENYQKWATYPPGAGGTPAREWKPGEADAWAEAHNLSRSDAAKGELLSAGAGLAAGGIAATIPAVLPHTVEGVKAIGAWADAHPMQAYMLYNVIKELVPGAKKALGLVKGMPTD
jgi:hypothetical protein